MNLVRLAETLEQHYATLGGEVAQAVKIVAAACRQAAAGEAISKATPGTVAHVAEWAAARLRIKALTRGKGRDEAVRRWSLVYIVWTCTGAEHRTVSRACGYSDHTMVGYALNRLDAPALQAYKSRAQTLVDDYRRTFR